MKGCFACLPLRGSCLPRKGSKADTNEAIIHLEQNPTWRSGGMDPALGDGLDGLPMNAAEWTREHVVQWLETIRMPKMKSKLQGMDGRTLLSLERDDVLALVGGNNTMDCFVFSAHLGELRRRGTADLDMTDTPAVSIANTPRYPPPSCASLSLQGTPRFPFSSRPGNPLGLPEQYMHKRPSDEPSQKLDSSGAVEILVREPTIQSLEEMLAEVLKEAKASGNRDQIRRALLQVRPHRRLQDETITDDTIDEAIEDIINDSHDGGLELKEALMSALWNPLIPTPEELEQEADEAELEAARGLAEADALCTQMGSCRSDATFASSVASSQDGQATSGRDRSIHEEPLFDDLVPIRSKFATPPETPTKAADADGDSYESATEMGFEDIPSQSLVDISHISQACSDRAQEAALESVLLGERVSGGGDQDASMEQEVRSAVLWQLRTSPKSSPRFTSPRCSTSPRWYVSPGRRMAPVIFEAVGEGEEEEEEASDEEIRCVNPPNSARELYQAMEASMAAEAAAGSAALRASLATEPISETSSPISTPKLALAEDEALDAAELNLSDTNSTIAPADTELQQPAKATAKGWVRLPGMSFLGLSMASATPKKVPAEAIALSIEEEQQQQEEEDQVAAEATQPLSVGVRGAAGKLRGGVGADGYGEEAEKGVYGVPLLPDFYVQRPEIFDQVKSEVLAERSVAIVAMDNLLGIGTSTLAAAVARDSYVKAQYPGGVFWLSFENDADDRTKLNQLLGMMMEAGFEAPQTRQLLPDSEYFQSVLHSAPALLVLDAVPNYSFAKMFIEFGFVLVVTSHEQGLPRQLGITTCVVPVIESDQTPKFLSLACGRQHEGQADMQLEEIARSCGGLPMEMATVAMLAADQGGSKTNKAGLKKLAKKLKSGNPLKEFAGVTGDKHFVSMLRTLAVSVDLLPISKQTLYRSLAILPASVAAPMSFLSKLWSIEEKEGVSPVDAALEVALYLQKHGLADVEGVNTAAPVLRLHDLHICFLTQWTAGQLESMHETLLVKYRQGETSFARVEDDGYYMLHAASHLIKAGREPQLRMLLFDIPWLEAKVAKHGVYATLSDFAMYLAVQDDTEVKLLMQALEMSAPAIRAEPTARGLLLTQMACRLRSRSEKHQGLDRWIAAVSTRLSDSQSGAGPVALWPRSGSLTQAGGSLVKTLSSAMCAPTKFLSLTPDGTTLLTVEGRVSRLWDVRSGYCVRVLEGFKDSILNGALSPDGSVAVTIADFCGRDIARVWDCSSGKCRHVLEGHTDLIQDLKISDDSKWCVTASYDMTARMWDLSTGSCTKTLEGHTDYIEAVAFSKDASRAVTASWDRTARIWHTADGVCLHVLDGHSDRVWQVEIGSKFVVTTSWDSTACVWELSSGEGIWRLEGHNDVIHSVAISDCEQWVVTSSQDGTSRVWDIELGECCQELTEQSATGKIAVTRDGSKLIAVCEGSDMMAQVWDLKTGSPLQTLEGHGDKITDIAVTADGQYVMTASWDRTARLWDLSTFTSSQEKSHRGAITAVAAVRSTGAVVSSSTDQTARLWDPSGAVAHHTLEPAGLALTVIPGLQEGCQMAATIALDGCMRLWDLSTGACLQTNQLEGDHQLLQPATPLTARSSRSLNTTRASGSGGFGHGCVIAAGGKTIASCLGGNRTVEVWVVNESRKQALIMGQLEHEDPVEQLVLSEDGQTAITVSGNNVYIWEAVDEELKGVLDAIHGDICSVAVNSKGNVLLTTTRGGIGTVWDLETLSPEHSLQLSLPDDRYADVFAALSPDGSAAVTACGSGHVQIWETKEGRLLHSLPCPSALSDISVSPSGQHAIACSPTGSLYVWDIRQGSQTGIFVVDAPLRCCTLHEAPGGALSTITGDANGQLHVLSLLP